MDVLLLPLHLPKERLKAAAQRVICCLSVPRPLLYLLLHQILLVLLLLLLH
jgi:hypothetical protein